MQLNILMQKTYQCAGPHLPIVVGVGVRQPKNETAAVVPLEAWQLCHGFPKCKQMLDNVSIWLVSIYIQEMIPSMLLREAPESHLIIQRE